MILRDPVCGKRINRNKAHMTIQYRGSEVHLCCPVCQGHFERDPERYVDTANSANPDGRGSRRGGR